MHRDSRVSINKILFIPLANINHPRKGLKVPGTKYLESLVDKWYTSGWSDCRVPQLCREQFSQVRIKLPLVCGPGSATFGTKISKKQFYEKLAVGYSGNIWITNFHLFAFRSPVIVCYSSHDMNSKLKICYSSHQSCSFWTKFQHPFLLLPFFLVLIISILPLKYQS